MNFPGALGLCTRRIIRPVPPRLRIAGASTFRARAGRGQTWLTGSPKLAPAPCKLGMLKVPHGETRERASVATLGFDAKSFGGVILLQQRNADLLDATGNDDAVKLVGDFLKGLSVGGRKCNPALDFKDVSEWNGLANSFAPAAATAASTIHRGEHQSGLLLPQR